MQTLIRSLVFGGCLAPSPYVSAQSCLIITGSKCEDIMTELEDSWCDIATPCVQQGPNLVCPSQTFSTHSFPDADIEGFRSAGSGESGNTTFASDEVACRVRYVCVSTDCQSTMKCKTDFTQMSLVVTGYDFTPTSGSECSVP